MVQSRSFTAPFTNKSVVNCVLLLLAFSLLLGGCKDEQEVEVPDPVRPVKLHTVEQGVNELQMSLPGRIRAARRSELSFKVSGPLQELPIEEGQVVKKGDLIAQILPRDFETAITESKARELEAKQQYNRYKELYSKRQVSKADFDRYRASRDVARAQLEDARNALKDTTLVAPFDGVIAKRYVENFQKVKEKEPIAYLQLIDKLEILIDVPELMMAQFRQGGEAEITAEFDSAPGNLYELTIKEFSTDADPATQTYQVVLAMDQPEEVNIFPGMTAKVTATTSDLPISGTTSIIIPAIAVLNDADGSEYVWIYSQDSKSVTKAKVSIGPLEGSTNILVSEGLKGGDTIVVTGGSKLREGMQVRPWENQREGN
ncbi:MAG: efflux RND transporter periplasmic adaptor subunit [Desulfocapsaceae bacterium]